MAKKARDITVKSTNSNYEKKCGCLKSSKFKKFVILNEVKNPVFMRVLDSSFHVVSLRMTLLRQPHLILTELFEKSNFV